MDHVSRPTVWGLSWRHDQRTTCNRARPPAKATRYILFEAMSVIAAGAPLEISVPPIVSSEPVPGLSSSTSSGVEGVVGDGAVLSSCPPAGLGVGVTSSETSVSSAVGAGTGVPVTSYCIVRADGK